MISQYNLEKPEGIHNLINLIGNRGLMQGFIVSDAIARWPAIIQELAGWLKAGKLKYREDIAEGLENAPRAFIGMLQGRNLGKQLARIAPERV
jgi:NADPH-dependent curcumin reductase CurA